MKQYFFLLLFWAISAKAQVRIHSHNDYEQEIPLFNAIQQKAWCIEADIFPMHDTLWVAHDKSQINPMRTLDKMYLDPIDSMFRTHHGTISEDSSYHPVLMIDIKELPAEAIRLLSKKLMERKSAFGTKKNPGAMKVMISGERGAIEDWTKYPAYIFIDGRPYETYNTKTLKKVMMISDNYYHYVRLDRPGELDSLETAIRKIHNLRKPVRFWAAPDSPMQWSLLIHLGVDIISTNRVAECRQFLDARR